MVIVAIFELLVLIVVSQCLNLVCCSHARAALSEFWVMLKIQYAVAGVGKIFRVAMRELLEFSFQRFCAAREILSFDCVVGELLPLPRGWPILLGL